MNLRDFANVVSDLFCGEAFKWDKPNGLAGLYNKVARCKKIADTHPEEKPFVEIAPQGDALNQHVGGASTLDAETYFRPLVEDIEETDKMNKLYRVHLRNSSTGLANPVAYDTFYVVAPDTEKAYQKVRQYLNSENLMSHRERALDSVDLLAEECKYPDSKTILISDLDNLLKNDSTFTVGAGDGCTSGTTTVGDIDPSLITLT